MSDYTDLKTRLKRIAALPSYENVHRDVEDATQAIEALQAEVEQLKDIVLNMAENHADKVIAMAEEIERLKDGRAKPKRSNGAHWHDAKVRALTDAIGEGWSLYDDCSRQEQAVIDKWGESLPKPPVKTPGRRLYDAAERTFAIMEWESLGQTSKDDLEAAAIELGIEPEEIP